MVNITILFLVFMHLVFVSICNAQLASIEDGQPSNGELPDSYLYLSYCVLAFGLCLAILLGLIIYKKNPSWDQNATRVFTVTLVIIAGLFLMTAGYSSQQVAPMFGLLGTMVGYIFGRASAKEEKDQPLSSDHN